MFSKVAFCREFKTEKLSLISKRKLPLKFLTSQYFPLILVFYLARARARARAPAHSRARWAPPTFPKRGLNSFFSAFFLARARFFRSFLFLNSALNGESLASRAAYIAEN